MIDCEIIIDLILSLQLDMSEYERSTLFMHPLATGWLMLPHAGYTGEDVDPSVHCDRFWSILTTTSLFLFADSEPTAPAYILPLANVEARTICEFRAREQAAALEARTYRRVAIHYTKPWRDDERYLAATAYSSVSEAQAAQNAAFATAVAAGRIGPLFSQNMSMAAAAPSTVSTSSSSKKSAEIGSHLLELFSSTGDFLRMLDRRSSELVSPNRFAGQVALTSSTSSSSQASSAASADASSGVASPNRLRSMTSVQSSGATPSGKPVPRLRTLLIRAENAVDRMRWIEAINAPAAASAAAEAAASAAAAVAAAVEVADSASSSS